MLVKQLDYDRKCLDSTYRKYSAPILRWMVNLWVERLRPALLLRKELRDPLPGTEEQWPTQQAIEPRSHSLPANPEQTGSVGFVAQGIPLPPRILFR